MENEMELRVHHIGCIVKDLDKAVELHESMGYEVAWKTKDPYQGIDVVFMKLEETLVELIVPLGENSVIERYASKSLGPYHLAYCSEKYEEDKESFRKKHFIPITEEMEGFSGHDARFIFYYSKNIGIVELIEKY